jgi:hypothetical protein
LVLHWFRDRSEFSAIAGFIERLHAEGDSGGFVASAVLIQGVNIGRWCVWVLAAVIGVISVLSLLGPVDAPWKSFLLAIGVISFISMILSLIPSKAPRKKKEQRVTY